MTSFFHDLEDQLRAAAQQRTSGAQARGDSAPPAPGRRGRRRWLAEGARLVPIAVAVAVTLAVVGGALVLLGHRGGQPPTPPASGGADNAFAALVQKTPKAQLKREFALIGAASNKVEHLPACRMPPFNQPRFATGAPAQTLLSTLGVLRRPATQADRVDLRGFGLGGPGMTIYPNAARRALTVAGTTYYIVPIRVAASGAYPSARCFTLQRQALRQALPTIAANLRTPTLVLQAALMDYDRRLSTTPAQVGVCVLARFGRGSSTDCGEPLSAIRHPIIPTDDGGTYSGVVPDGVGSVTLRFPATASKAAVSVTGAVRDNLFVVRPPAGVAPKVNAEPVVVWRAADGTVLKTFTPPGPAALKKLCLDRPEACARTMTLSSSSSSVRAAKLAARQVGAGTSGTRSKPK